MKNLGKMLLVTLVTLGLLVACGSKDAGTGGAEAGAKVKVGIGSVQTVSEKDEGEKAEFNAIVVGVALQDDKIVHVSIDQSQQKVAVEGEEAVMDLAQTKKQQGDAYDMKKASPIGKEWFEQIEAVEKDLVGKTKDEAVAYFAGDDVKSSATITVDAFSEALVKAIDTAVEVDGAAKVGFGYDLSVKADDKGAQSVVDFAMVAVDADGKIVKALLDNSQEKAELTEGKLVGKNIGKTKGELKEAYGMKEFGPADAIGVEWYEQNNSLMEALVGKTIDEVAALTLESEDIKSSVTIHIDAAQAAIANAAKALVDVK